MLRTILIVVQVISGFIIVGLVLLQRGKGADAGAGFGAGASGTVFGARGATTGLSRMTAIFAAIFMINSLALTYSFRQPAAPVQEQGLLDQVEGAAAAPAGTPAATPAPAAAPVDADAVPTAPAQQVEPQQVPPKP
jgi:preprotein translocase subunit SecG